MGACVVSFQKSPFSHSGNFVAWTSRAVPSLSFFSCVFAQVLLHSDQLELSEC